MTAHTDEHERTMAFAEIALGQIRALRQPATPRHFEIWYTYATGYNPSLNQMINEMLARNGTLSEADIDQIYETYISANRFTDRIDRVGSQVMGEIEQVMAMIGAAAGTASNYTESLADVTQKLGVATDEPAVRAIVESLVQATKEMEKNNRRSRSGCRPRSRRSPQLQENLEAVRNESLTDPLTSLANRKFFDDALAKAIADARAKGEPLSLMMTDIDHFKKFNDSYGHLTGDQVLRLVAHLGEAERQGPGHRRPLRRRGIRGGAAQYRAALRDHGRRPYPPRGDDQGTDEALDRRASRTGDDLGRRRGPATARQRPVADRARRQLPLRRQAQRPQPRDQRGRPGSVDPGHHQGGVTAAT